MCLVAANGRFAKTAEQFLQRFVSEKVQSLFRDLEFYISRKRLADQSFALARFQLTPLLLRHFLEIEISLFYQPLDEFIDQRLEQGALKSAFVFGQHLF